MSPEILHIRRADAFEPAEGNMGAGEKASLSPHLGVGDHGMRDIETRR